MVIDGEAVGDTSGAGVAADVQPTTSRATTIVVERREIEGRIPMSSGRYVG
jgi:hypothetical protein